MTTDLTPYLPILIPLALLELTLMVVALVHVLTHSTYKTGNRIMWVLIVVLINIIGPVLYFVFGRSDAE